MQFLFYGENGDAAKAKATADRANGLKVRVLQAVACQEVEPVDSIEFMPDVSAFDRDRLTTLFGDVIAIAASASPPPPVDPLADIRRDPNWRSAKGRGIAKLKYVAAAISGRTPDSADEAIQIIDAALAAEKAPPPPPPSFVA